MHLYEDYDVAKMLSPIAFRIDADVKAALEEAAEADLRSVSALTQLILRNWLTERGYLSGAKKAATKRKAPRR